MAYDFNSIRNPIIKRLFQSIFNLTSGHDHDGVNSKAVTVGTVADGAVTNAKLATDVKVGSLATLDTTEKTSVVGAINEVNTNTDTANTSIGTLANLTTTAKNNLVVAINEVDADIAAATELATDASNAATSAVSAVAAKASLTGEETFTNKTLTTPIIASLYQDAGKTKLMTLPNTASDTIVTLAAEQTLSNKTLTSPIIDDGDAGLTVTSADQTHATPTVTIPNIVDAADIFVMADTAQTLTNKTLTSPILTSPILDDTDTGLTLSITDQTHASATLVIPDIVGETDGIVCVGLAQTLTNKTLTEAFLGSPEITFRSTPHDYEAGATDWTLSATELKASILKPTNANAPVNAIVADSTNKIYIVINGTGQTLTVKTAAGTGITIANAKSAMVMSDGINVIRITADA